MIMMMMAMVTLEMMKTTMKITWKITGGFCEHMLNTMMLSNEEKNNNDDINIDQIMTKTI